MTEATSQPDRGAAFVEGSLFRHIAVMTGAASIGFMALFAVDLVDMLFISMLGETELAAAIGYAGAVLLFTTSISIGLSICMEAMVARAIGAGDQARAERYTGSVVGFTLLTTIPFTILLWIWIPESLDLLRADGRAHDLAVGYLRIVVPSMPVLALAMCAIGILRAVGDAKQAMLATLGGGAVNAALDPVLIFALGLGVNGAALASVAARITVLGLGWWAIRRHLQLRKVKLAHLLEDLRPIVTIAGPAVLTNIASPIGSAYVTATVASFGHSAVAGATVIGRIIPVAFAVVFALSGAIGPIIGQNFGAGRLDRVRTALRQALAFQAAVVLVIAFVLVLLRPHIVAVFGIGGDAAALVNFYFTFVAVTFAFTGAQFVANGAFNNLAVPAWSAGVTWLKATLGTIPFVWAGATLAGPEGAFAGQALGTSLVALLAGWLTFVRLDQLDRHAAEAPGEPPPATPFFRVPFVAFSRRLGWFGVAPSAVIGRARSEPNDPRPRP